MRLPFCSQKEKRDENAMLADLLSWAVMDEMRAGGGGGVGELGEEECENTQKQMNRNEDLQATEIIQFPTQAEPHVDGKAMNRV